MSIRRNSLGRFKKGNQYWLGKKGIKKPNKGSFRKGNVPWNVGKRTYKICEKCGKDFSTNKGKMTKPNQRFCSLGCSSKSQSGRNWPKCIVCGKNIRYKRKYCRDCYKGKNHHWWKGGVTKEGSLIRTSAPYKKWRKAVFERDNSTFCFFVAFLMQSSAVFNI